MVSSLMADWNAVLHKLSFVVLKIPVNVLFFTHLALLDLKLNLSFVRSGEKAFKSLNNSMVRNCEFVWCTKTELSVFF